MARTTCSRCARGLKDPRSVERGMGPVCWAASNGNVFEDDLNASVEEWARREALLRNGGEIDLGANWQHIDYDPDMALQVPLTMRVSVRYREGAFEAYGVVFDPRGDREIVFERTGDLKAAYAVAVKAGPESNAQVHRITRARRSRHRRAA